MKKILFVMLVSLLAVNAASAQRRKGDDASATKTAATNKRVMPLFRNELSASYGYLTHTYVGDPVSSKMVGFISNGKPISMKELGSFSLQYMRALDSKLYVGGMVTYEIGKSDGAGSNGLSEKIKVTGNYVSIMPSLKYYWYDSKYFGFYSRGAVGVMFASYDISRTKTVGDERTTTSKPFLRADVAFQGSPLCIEAGTTWLRAFVECGYGNQGVVLAGLKYCF